MTNYERIKNLTVEEMAKEIKDIANWDRKQKRIAEQDSQFYVNWLNSEAPDDKCKVMDTDYCKNECPLCRLEPERIDVTELNNIADKSGVLSSRKNHHTKNWDYSTK